MNELRDLVELRMIHCSTQKFSFDRSEDGSLKKVWPPASKAKEPTLRKRPGNATQPAVQSSRSMYADSPSQLCIRNFESHTEQRPRQGQQLSWSGSSSTRLGPITYRCPSCHCPSFFSSSRPHVISTKTIMLLEMCKSMINLINLVKVFQRVLTCKIDDDTAEDEPLEVWR